MQEHGKRESARKILGDEIPVDEIPESIEVIRTAIAEVNIISMFPDVTGHQRLEALFHRISSRTFLRDDQLAGFVFGQKRPA